MKDFRKVKTWEKAHRLVLRIYDATKSFPDSEKFGLVNQMRRCAASIPANIAEGCGKDSDADLARFLLISMGSSSELHYFIILARDLSLLSVETAGELEGAVEEVKRMLSAFVRHLKERESFSGSIKEESAEYSEY